MYVYAHLLTVLREQCVEEPDARAHMVEECLRLESPLVSMPRIARHDGEFRGTPIAAGSFSLLCLAAANRQPDVYEHPDDFVPDRWVPGSKTAPLLTFGYSAHFCLGAPTARAEMRVLLDVLAERRPEITLTRQPQMLGTMMRRADRVEVQL